MFAKNRPLDVIEKILEACYNANKDALFVMSLMHQYEDRGFLTKKQMQGLHSKAQKVKDIPPGLLATLEATIAKLPTKDKTPAVIKSVETLIDVESQQQIGTILAKYPHHKALLALQFKIEKNKVLTPSEKAELVKFYKLLIK